MKVEFLRYKSETTEKDYSLDDIKSLSLFNIINDFDRLNEEINHAINTINYKQEEERLYVIGMGGSSLGAKAVLRWCENDLINFIDSLDGLQLLDSMNEESLKKSKFLIVSKSGNTPETLTLFQKVLMKMKKHNMNSFNKNVYIVTNPELESKLMVLVKQHQLNVFRFKKDLSGRFSVLSLPGLLPLVIAGFKLRDIHEICLDSLANKRTILNLFKILSESIENNDTAQNFWSYERRFDGFLKWLRQLTSESLGKPSPSFVGYKLPPFVYCKGSEDQHSYLQQVLADPTSNLNFIFSTKQNSNASFISKEKLNEKNRLRAYLTRYKIRQVDFQFSYIDRENDIFRLLVIWMTAVHMIGTKYKLDTYGQSHIDELKIMELT